MFYLIRKNKKFVIFSVLTLGILLRILTSLKGHNFDSESYWIVANIVDEGGNVYAETRRYNYGPPWFMILFALFKLTQNFSNHFEAFKMSITIFLTLVDILIALILYKKFGLKVFIFFFLNPISIFITGYHRQFDNFAILIGLISVLMLEDQLPKGLRKKHILSLFLLGLSLMIKHILIIFPFWLAFKKPTLFHKIIFVCLPIGLFLASFVPYLSNGGAEGMKYNVLNYQSYVNYPFWYLFTPEVLVEHIPVRILFLSTLLIFGLIVRKQKTLDLFTIYLGAVITFSAAITNQYLAIPSVFIARKINPILILFVVISFIYLLAGADGAHLKILADLPWNFKGYNLQMLLFTIGFFVALWPKEIKKGFKSIVSYFYKEVRMQLKIK